MSELEQRFTRLTVAPKDAPLFSERAIHLAIEDEAAGEFVILTRHTDQGSEKFGIDPSEWKTLRTGIDRMIEACRPRNDEA